MPQQVANTFTGGLNTDVHPLSAKSSILTDAYNVDVTTITGNQFVLQKIEDLYGGCFYKLLIKNEY